MKKVLIMFCLLLIIILIIIFAQNNKNLEQGINKNNKTQTKNNGTVDELYQYTFNDDVDPGSEYNVKIYSKSRKLEIVTKNFCSAVDCETTVTKCSVKLTNDEYEKIMLIWDNKRDLSPILNRICKNDSVMYESFEKSTISDKTKYEKVDTNSDGKISNREFANNWLNIVIEGK